MDVSNRPYLVYRVEARERPRSGDFDVSSGGGLPLRLLPERRPRSARRAPLREEPPPRGGGGRSRAWRAALRVAVERDPRVEGLPTVKGASSAPRCRPPPDRRRRLRRRQPAQRREGAGALAALQPEVTGDPAAVIRRADGVVLPGVGAFADAVADLRAKGLDRGGARVDRRRARPYLGPVPRPPGALRRERGARRHARARLLPGRVEPLRRARRRGRPLRVPHIGWNTGPLRGRATHPMLEGFPRRTATTSCTPTGRCPTNDPGDSWLAGPTMAATSPRRWRPRASSPCSSTPRRVSPRARRLLDAYAAWVRVMSHARSRAGARRRRSPWGSLHAPAPRPW